MQNYDVIIIGGGPAGMTAGIYSSRAGMKTLLIEKAGIGGQIAVTDNIENYPGFASIDGFTLSQSMFDQMTGLGVETIFGEIEDINLTPDKKEIKVNGVTYFAPCVILSMGAKARKLGVSSEDKFAGKGVSYCAVCDGAFFRGKDVAVIGGGNTALQDAIYLSKIANKVYLVHRREGLRAEQSVIDEFNEKVSEGKIETRFNYTIDTINGEDRVSNIVIKNTLDGSTQQLDVQGVFVAVGREPSTDILKGITLNDSGYIVVNSQMETNISGVFAAGDITQKELKQVATAISDGAIAGTNASKFARRFK